MAGYRDLFITGTNRLTRFVSTALLQKISGQKMILPFYHAISDKRLPHIANLYTPKNRKQFVNDLDFLLKNFVPIDFFQFDDIIKNKKKPSKPVFLLSFDDGLSEFYDVIAPILKKKGIPAICFLNEAFIDNKDLFYRYKVSLLIEEYNKNPRIFNEFIAKMDIQDLNKYLQSIDYNNKSLLDEIAADIDYNFKTFLDKNRPYLTSLQIKSLIKDGFFFGSHSIDHPEYRLLDIDQQLNQTVISTDNICTHFHLDYRIFSFPFTDFAVTKEFFDKIYQDDKIHYSFGTAGQKHDTAGNNFQRIPLEMSKLSAKEIINSELFYYIAKGFVGKNTIYRQ